MTSEDLSNLRELLEKATKGPWAVHPVFPGYVIPADQTGLKLGGAEDDEVHRREYCHIIISPTWDRFGRNDDRAHAALIVALRNKAEPLLDRIEELEGALRAVSEDASGCFRSDASRCLKIGRAARQALSQGEGG